MTVLLNQAIFTRGITDDSVISNVTVNRLKGGSIEIIFKTSKDEENTKVFNCLDVLNIAAKQHGGKHHRVSVRENNSVENIAKALLQLKDEKLLSQELFTEICANFPAETPIKPAETPIKPAETPIRIDHRVAKIVGVEPNILSSYARAIGKLSSYGSRKLLFSSKVDSNDTPFSEEIEFLPVKITRDSEVIGEIAYRRAQVLSARDALTDIPSTRTTDTKEQIAEELSSPPVGRMNN